MLNYDDAVTRILDGIAPLSPVDVPLLDSRGQVLACDVLTGIDLPPFANSQMDGYALIAADTTGAATENSVRLEVAGVIAAGTAAIAAVSAGVAMKIFTGAKMPPGADCVVPVEDTAEVDRGAFIDIQTEASAGDYVRIAGDDYRNGEVVLDRGLTVTPSVIALAAAIGRRTLSVHRRPRVCVISTGDELVAPGLPLGPGQIYDSNSYALTSQVEAAGAAAILRLHAADTVDALTAAMAHAEHSMVDVVITCGGVSVGDHDLVRPVFANRGEIDFWRVAIRPGKPFAFGRSGSSLFFGLPGNPASAMVTFELFVRPALMRLLGSADVRRPVVSATLTDPVSHVPGRRSFMRAITAMDVDGTMRVQPAGKQGSHLLRSMIAANSLLIVPEDVTALPAGATVRIMLI